MNDAIAKDLVTRIASLDAQMKELTSFMASIEKSAATIAHAAKVYEQRGPQK